jgi:Flp pilus assembly pilin Flp
MDALHTHFDARLATNTGTRPWVEKGKSMRKLLNRMQFDDRGMTTAEYAVGTVAAAGIGGVLIKLLTSTEVRNLIWKVISTALSAFF